MINRILILFWYTVLSISVFGKTNSNSSWISELAKFEEETDTEILRQADSITGVMVNLKDNYIKKAEKIVTKTKLTGNQAYILQKGSSFIYYSSKSKFPNISAPKQNYSMGYEGLLHSPESYYTIEMNTEKMIIHHRELIQVSCEFDSRGDVVPPVKSIGWTIPDKMEKLSGKIPVLGPSNLYYNIILSSSAKHLVFQTPRNMIIKGGSNMSDPEVLERQAAASGSKYRSGETGFYTTHAITGKRMGLDDPYAPWRIVQDQTLTLSFSEVAKANNVSKDELIWMLCFMNIEDITLPGTYVRFRDFDNAPFTFLLNKTFGLSKKMDQGRKYLIKWQVDKLTFQKKEDARLKGAAKELLKELSVDIRRCKKNMCKIFSNQKDYNEILDILNTLNSIKEEYRPEFDWRYNKELAERLSLVFEYKYTNGELTESQKDKLIDKAKEMTGFDNGKTRSASRRFMYVLDDLSVIAASKNNFSEGRFFLYNALLVDKELLSKEPSESFVDNLLRLCEYCCNLEKKGLETWNPELLMFIEWVEPFNTAEQNQRVYSKVIEINEQAGNKKLVKKFRKKLSGK